MITERLELIPATADLCEAEAQGPEAVGRALGVRVPASWPPPVFEPDDVERLRRQLERDPANHAWTLYYLVLPAAVTAEPRELVGIAGYAGPPSAEGVVGIGYAIAAEYQRRGYATEAVRALLSRAFAHAEVAAVTATTYATLEPSIGVLRKSGFALVGQEPASGLLRYEHRRDSGSGVIGPALTNAAGRPGAGIGE
jgi:RimJ/RimL family protein N-acetyltransferase